MWRRPIRLLFTSASRSDTVSGVEALEARRSCKSFVLIYQIHLPACHCATEAHRSTMNESSVLSSLRKPPGTNQMCYKSLGCWITFFLVWLKLRWVQVVCDNRLSAFWLTDQIYYFTGSRNSIRYFMTKCVHHIGLLSDLTFMFSAERTDDDGLWPLCPRLDMARTLPAQR